MNESKPINPISGRVDGGSYDDDGYMGNDGAADSSIHL